MRRPHTPGSVRIQLLSMPILEGVAFCTNVWKGSNHTDSKVAGAKIKVLW